MNVSVTTLARPRSFLSFVRSFFLCFLTILFWCVLFVMGSASKSGLENVNGSRTQKAAFRRECVSGVCECGVAQRNAC